MSNVKQVLTIAGSDSGGGAGIQADLKTFQMRGVFGTSVITAVTAQNTLGVFDIHPIPLKTIQAQLEAVKNDFQLQVAKLVCWAMQKLLNASQIFLLISLSARWC